MKSTIIDGIFKALSNVYDSFFFAKIGNSFRPAEYFRKNLGKDLKIYKC